MSHRFLQIVLALVIIAALVGGGLYLKISTFRSKDRSPEVSGAATATSTGSDVASFGPPAAEATETASATLWLGLKNSDDQGTAFDIRVELRRNDQLIAAGETLCVTGLTRNSDKARSVSIPIQTLSTPTPTPGDLLALTVSARIGTGASGQRCPGHGSATGLRLYYDSPARNSSFRSSLTPEPTITYSLHGVAAALPADIAPPTNRTSMQRDSAGLSIGNGNAWKLVGTWIVVPPDPGEAGKATLAGTDSDGDGLRDDVQRYIALTYPDSAKARLASATYAVAAGTFMVSGDDPVLANESAAALRRAIDCLFALWPDDAAGILTALQPQILNTSPRIRADLHTQSLLDVTTLSAPSPHNPKSSCDFNPDILPN